jgi:hypothetical protein
MQLWNVHCQFEWMMMMMMVMVMVMIILWSEAFEVVHGVAAARRHGQNDIRVGADHQQ